MNRSYFFGFETEFSKFLMKFWFSSGGFTEFLKSYATDTLPKKAIVFLMSIKWIYLVLCGDI